MERIEDNILSWIGKIGDAADDVVSTITGTFDAINPVSMGAILRMD